MLRSLWFKLSIAFAALSILSMAVLGLVTSVYRNYLDFRRIVVPETISEIVRSNQLLFSEAMKHPETGAWRLMAEKEMASDILDMSGEDGEFYIGFASNPEMYYRVYDAEGGLFASYPSTLPPEVEEVFRTNHDKGDAAITLGRHGLIWVSRPLVDGGGVLRGRMELLLDAEFAVWDLVERVVTVYKDRRYGIIFFFSLVGLLCGIVANRFVTGRLKRMNAAAAAWSAGDFSPRIAVDEKSRDILAEHSRTLNGMAGELEALVVLRQKDAVAEERNRVARELHDTVKQNLFALKLQLAAVKRKNGTADAAAHVEEAERITREAQEDIQCMLTQLDPVASEERGLFGRLAALADDMRRRYGVHIIWDRKETVASGPPEERALLRIAQEAMNNSVRHGRASEVRLCVFAEDGTNHLVLADDGCGLPAECGGERPTGMGLVSMRERAGELPGGEFAIGPNEHGGTTVHIRWSAT